MKKRFLVVAAILAFCFSGCFAAEDSWGRECKNGRYKNSSGEWVCKPEKEKDNSRPAGATAQCRDGSYSFSQHRSGTCSGHGGVAIWL
jgi:hypothetical protein